ncbi:MAG: response regulator [Pyrinomonadaceae bacterium]|nr:response regulator [Pyrinomonadaceae bacterium]
MATLLIVDDDTLIRDTLHDLLSPSHECHTADRAEQALAYLEMETYDVVLTDINMPGLSGHDLLNHIRSTHPTTPVIVISGIALEDTAKVFSQLGAFAYFTKPFKLEEVEDAVERAIARHQELVSAEQRNPAASDADE